MNRLMMLKLAPPLFTPTFLYTHSQPKLIVFEPSLYRNRQLNFILPFTLQNLWQMMQLKYKGHRKWAKSIDKYVRRLLKQFTFYPVVHRINSVFIINQPIFTHIAYLKQLSQPITRHGFNQFVKQADDIIKSNFGKVEVDYLTAKQQLADFIRYQNETFIIQEYHYAIPTPPVKPTYKENPLIIPEDYVAQGKRLMKIVKQVFNHWQTTQHYTRDDIIGWLIFSGIVFGGINSQPLLSAWLDTLLKGDGMAFDNERLLINVRYANERYGNEMVGEQLFNTQQVIVDLVSQCWLYCYHQSKLTQILSQDIEGYLLNALQPFIDNLGYRNITLNWLLKNASYFWTMLPQVNINQALVGVMQGKHKTTGLIADDFIRFLQANHSIDTTTSNYDLLALAKLVIVSEAATPNPTLRVIKAQVRRFDLIERIKKLFSIILDKKYTVPLDPVSKAKINKAEYLIGRVRALQSTFSLINEQILIGWVVALLQAKTANYDSILHYLGIIGYEWLYFTNAQAIEIWTDEDFTELYDEILEYKAHTLGNADIAYVARRLQALHNYALKAGWITVKVVIEQAKSKLKVRAQLLSPHTYIALLEQIHTHVTDLDRDMLKLLFILAYRLGMRKKELLGLTFGDLEALYSDEPSLVIRPNLHRSTKTEGSIRRIPFFGLLTQSEITFATNYLRSQHGGKASRLVFSFSDSQIALPTHFPLQFFRQLLADIGADDSITFHAFRHCTLTNLALVLNADTALASRLTGYQEQEISQIRHVLLGVETYAQDRWYALASLMGHLTPERSFEYYNHLATLMATYTITNAHYAKYVTFDSFSNITGFTKVRLKENGYQIDKDTFELANLRPLLLRLSLQKPKPVTASFDIDQPIDFASIGKRQLSDNLLDRYSVQQVLDFLRYLDDGINFEKAYIDANIEPNDAQIIHDKAQYVANLTTQKGKSKFTKVGKLSPLHVQKSDEQKRQRLLLSQLKQLLSGDKQKFDEFLQLGLDRLSTEQSALALSIDELQQFIPIAKFLCPDHDKHWLIRFDIANTDVEKILTDNNFAPTKKLLTPMQPKTDKQPTRQRRKTKACDIGIIYQQPSKHSKQAKFSSVLRFVVHYTFLMTNNATA